MNFDTKLSQLEIKKFLKRFISTKRVVSVSSCNFVSQSEVYFVEKIQYKKMQYEKTHTC